MAESLKSATVVDIILPLEQSESESSRRSAAPGAGHCRIRIQQLRLRKHSIDARQKQIKVQLRRSWHRCASARRSGIEPNYRQLATGARSVVIVGCGPAGMFAALRCIELGLRPIVLERGKDASARRFDLGPILKKGTVIDDSNYCFGEGGAGTYSDGKLYTRATKRGPVRHVYETLVAHGAPERILIDAHPHIGSNLLPKVVMAMRNSILAAGGEVHFGTKVTGFDLLNGRIRGVQTADGREFSSERVILATGHSARDIYQLLHDQSITLEQKPLRSACASSIRSR